MTDNGKSIGKLLYLSEELKHVNNLLGEGRIDEAFQEIEELEKRKELSPHNRLSIKILRCKYYNKAAKYLEVLTYSNEILKENQQYGDLLIDFDTYLNQAHAYLMIGNLSKGEDFLNQSEILFEKLKGIPNNELRERESSMIRNKSIISSFKGDSHQAIILNKKALELAQECQDTSLISFSLINIAEGYRNLGDYDKAIYFAKRSVEVPNPLALMWRMGHLIDSYLSKGDIANAKLCFQQMKEQREKDQSDRGLKAYKFFKAKILKTSLRAKDRVKAEELFKQFLEEKADFQFMVEAIFNICGLLLIELRITNDREIFQEIDFYVNKLLQFAEHQKNYTLLAKTYLLQSKIVLLNFNIKASKRFLIQVQQIAKRFSIKEFYERIDEEKKNIISKSNSWEKLEELDAPMADRMELAQIDDLIGEVSHKRFNIIPQVTEEKVAIHEEKKICIVCRGEVFRFSYICECGSIYCENCARALINLENVCWACDAPIDYSKPIKPYKEEVTLKPDKKKDKD
ncbi:MAG: hypothetical protein ACFFB0_08000 [Promethearchaeota archaeon]